jgi:hypothetical protein
MAEKKRVTTAPLTEQEIAENLFEIPAEEFLERFDEIFSRDLDLPERLEELITLDDYMDNELREMFQSIIAQYIRPIEFSVERLREGDYSKRTAEEGLEALSPILSASQSLGYQDITVDFGQIERSLRDLAEGVKRRLTKREVAEIGEAWERLDARLRPDGEREAPQSPGPISLGSLPRFLDGITAAHVRSLRNAGLTTLTDIAGAPLGDLVDVTGLADVVAERIHSFAIGAVAMAATSGERRATANVPAGWTRVQIDGDAFKGRFMFETSTVARYLEPILARLAEAEAAPAPAPAKKKKAAVKPRATRARAADKKR